MEQSAAVKKRTVPALPPTAARALPLLVPAALVLAVLFAYGIRYATNDDATLANIAAGAYGPDRIRLVYVNILFGCLLRPLYALAPGVNWYVLVQLALLAAAGAALCRLLCGRFGAGPGCALFLALALSFAVALVYEFHYVKVSGVCLAAGLAWLAVHLGAPLTQKLAGPCAGAGRQPAAVGYVFGRGRAFGGGAAGWLPCA